jgi:hypothetical protein
MELRPEPTPTTDEWRQATAVSEPLFGVLANPYLTPAAVADFTEQIRARAAETVNAAPALTRALEDAYARLAVDDSPTGRLATARAAASLTERLTRATDRLAVVRLLAESRLPGTAEAVANSLSTADRNTRALTSYAWDRLGELRGASGNDDRSRDAAGILARLRAGLVADEIVTPLSDALAAAERETFDWAIRGRATTDEPVRPVVDPDQVPIDPAGRARRRPHGDAAPVLAELGAFLTEHAGDEVEVSWRIVE